MTEEATQPLTTVKFGAQKSAGGRTRDLLSVMRSSKTTDPDAL